MFCLRGMFGHVHAQNGEYVNYFERFKLGYTSFRGFSQSGIGPRGIVSTEKTVNGEISFPLSVDVPLKIISFVDGGSLWGLGTPKPGAENVPLNKDVKVSISPGYDKAIFRLSIGLGVQVDIPFIGRIVLGVAKPLKKESYDQEENVFFSMGTEM